MRNVNESYWLEEALVLILEIVIASTAVALIMLSLKTLQAIKHLGVGKTFWMPVAVSGFLFFFGSIVAILFELNFSLSEYTDEVVQISRLFALCILVGGVYSYSRKVTENLGKEFTLAEKTAKANHTVKMGAPVIAPPTHIQERTTQERAQCRYQFGYLRTLPIDAPIPDECLSCDRIIKCKHSSTKTIESEASSPQ